MRVNMAYEALAPIRLILIKADSSDFSGIQMSRQQISQFQSEDFVAHDLQILLEYLYIESFESDFSRLHYDQLYDQSKIKVLDETHNEQTTHTLNKLLGTSTFEVIDLQPICLLTYLEEIQEGQIQPRSTISTDIGLGKI